MDERERRQIENILSEAVEGLHILKADAAIDEARRLLWLAQFKGKKISEIKDAPVNEPPWRMALALAGKPLDIATQILEGGRLAIWLSCFPDANPDLFDCSAEQGTIQ